MLYWATIGLLAVALGTFSWWALIKRRMHVGNWIGCAAVFVWLAGSGIKIHHDRTSRIDSVDELLQSGATLSWGAGSAAPPPASRASATPGTVGSLVGGLEAKLAANPDDVSGWALLAQSYAFIGDTEGTERAIAHAVALGFDEQDLRGRVDHARRDTLPRQSPTGG